MSKIVCFGEALIDFLPDPNRIAGTSPAYLCNAGGAPANVAVAIAKLGGASAFVGMFGEDAFGDFLLNSLRQAGVDTTYAVRTAQANTALAFVTLSEQGERSFNFYRGPSADLLFRDQHFKSECFTECSILHVCSNSLTEPDIAETTLRAMTRATEAGALVSFDMNLRPALWHSDPRPGIWGTLSQADLIKLSTEEMDYLCADGSSREQVFKRLWQGQAQLVVLTDGGGPLQWFTRHNRGTLKSLDVVAIDTTAAGDAFVGGLLYSLSQQPIPTTQLGAFADTDAWQKSLRYAAACGAIAVTRHGSFIAMPNGKEVDELLEEYV